MEMALIGYRALIQIFRIFSLHRSYNFWLGESVPRGLGVKVLEIIVKYEIRGCVKLHSIPWTCIRL